MPTPRGTKIKAFQDHIRSVYGAAVALDWFFDGAEPGEEIDAGTVITVTRTPAQEWKIVGVPYWGEVPCRRWEKPERPPTVDLMLNGPLMELHRLG